MIKLTGKDGYDEYLAAGAIARISETSSNMQYRGIHAMVHTFNGAHPLEVRQKAADIAHQVEEQLGLQAANSAK